MYKLKEATERVYRLKSEFYKIYGYKINVKNQMYPLHCNKQIENENLETSFILSKISEHIIFIDKNIQ